MPWLKLATANDTREYELGIVYYSGQLKNKSFSKVNEIEEKRYSLIYITLGKMWRPHYAVILPM